MKVFISADIEGASGLVAREEASAAGVDWGRARARMTGDVLAAIEGARAGGATAFVVADSHGPAINIHPEELPADAELVRGWPRPGLMMEGVERPGTACAFLVGYHAGAHVPGGGLAHSFSSRLFREVAVDGEVMSELGLAVGMAAHHRVPVALVSGDDVALQEARGLAPDALQVETKTSLGFFSARARAPSAVQQDLRVAAQRAVENLGRLTPGAPMSPGMATVSFKQALPAEVLAYLPMFERCAADTVRFEVEDAPALSRILQFMLMTTASLV
jgi:D-amino peptidase